MLDLVDAESTMLHAESPMLCDDLCDVFTCCRVPLVFYMVALCNTTESVKIFICLNRTETLRYSGGFTYLRFEFGKIKHFNASSG